MWNFNLELAPGALSGLALPTTPGAYANPDGSLMNLEQMAEVGNATYTPEKIQPATVTPTPTPTPANPVPERDYAAEQRAYEARQLGDTLEAYFQQFGLNGIAAWAKQSAKDGRSAEWIKFNARNQDEYKRRFPAMQYHLDNMTGFTEQDYINYEQLARNLDQQYGIPDSMIYNSVTDLLTNDVDGEELADRAAMAGAAAIQAPDDFKTTMRDYYGIDEGGLTAYFLDPDKAVDSLRKQSAASLSGTIAARQGVPNVAKDLAEDLYDRGVRDEDQMIEGYGQAAQLRGLSSGKANTVNTEQLVRGSFGDSAAEEAMAKVSRIRRATNRGGGGYVGGESGAKGLGSSSV